MTFQIRLLPAAREDLREIIAHYRVEQVGLDERFLDALDRVLDKLTIFWATELKYDQVRTRRIERFPYIIHYQVLETRQILQIEAIVHERSKPRG